MLLDEMSDGDISKLWDLSGVVCAMCQHCHIPRVYRPCLFCESPWAELGGGWMRSDNESRAQSSGRRRPTSSSTSIARCVSGSLNSEACVRVCGGRTDTSGRGPLPHSFAGRARPSSCGRGGRRTYRSLRSAASKSSSRPR